MLGLHELAALQGCRWDEGRVLLEQFSAGSHLHQVQTVETHAENTERSQYKLLRSGSGYASSDDEAYQICYHADKSFCGAPHARARLSTACVQDGETGRAFVSGVFSNAQRLSILQKRRIANFHPGAPRPASKDRSHMFSHHCQTT